MASPDSFWTQGIAAIGKKFDLSQVKRTHIGSDGEGWCKRGWEFLPGATEAIGHLDPFHINRAVLSCFSDSKAAWKVLEVLHEGDIEEAACLLEAFRDFGIAREKQTRRTVTYLRRNAELIGIEGPTLGTMESENQHLYGSRMDSVPCAWSRRGASDMARIRSRTYSGRKLPRITRNQSMSSKKTSRRERRVLSSLAKKGSSRVVEPFGSGYLPPHHASAVSMPAEVRYRAGLDFAMV